MGDFMTDNSINVYEEKKEIDIGALALGLLLGFCIFAMLL
jgi:hypothetical protein